jgi:mevalonate kinase
MAIGYGKVIVLGEHGVVYGKPALGAAIGVGCYASAVPANFDSLSVEMSGADVDSGTGRAKGGFGGPPPEPSRFYLAADRPVDHPEQEKMRRAFNAVLSAYPPSRPPFAVSVRMEVPGGAGLGCSAACGVAVVKALDEACALSRDPETVAEASMPWERVFHGNPSGMDSAIAASGAIAVFRKGVGLHKIVATRPPLFVIAHSGVASSTITTVQAVARLHAAFPEKTRAIFDEIGSLVEQGAEVLEKGALDRLGALMNRDQELLSSLQVSTPRLDEMCASARHAGAWGAKLTGSGGGGCMIALAPDRPTAQQIVRDLQSLGRDTLVVQVGTT